MWQLSKKSNDNLATCEKDLQIIFNKAILYSPYDFAIIEGHRTTKRQAELYRIGRAENDDRHTVTDCDGINSLSEHNYYPSRALDIMAYINGAHTWEKKYYDAIAEHVLTVAADLYDEAAVKHRPKWGGNFNFYDGGHYELIQ